MAELYSKCFEVENIKLAIKIIRSHSGSITAGPDGINKNSNVFEERIIKEVKMRLRRCKAVRSRKIEIPKGNGKTRTLTVCNLYDRIAQQAVYQVIEPILDQNMSNNSYGFRKGINAKVAVSRLCASVSKFKNGVYTVEVDFEKCFDNIPLDKAIDMLRELGITSGRLLKTIKHLMYTSKEYKGIGLGQGTILGPILANCYLHKLDTWVEENLDLERKNTFGRDFKAHKKEWSEWLQSRGRKPMAKYYRYADDTIITTGSRAEQLMIFEMLKRFVEEELNITINEAKSKLEYNEMNFLGFRILKRKANGINKIGITPAEPKELQKKVSEMKWNSPENARKSLKVIIGLLNYFDIANNLNPLCSAINLRLLKISSRSGSAITRRKGTSIYTFSLGGKRYIIDVYGIRKSTKVSYKEYLFNYVWLTERDNLNDLDEYIHAHHIYKWSVWTKQKGIDPVSKEKLRYKVVELHHINGNHNDNRMENLVALNPESHKLIHRKEPTTNRIVNRYRKALSVNS